MHKYVKWVHEGYSAVVKPRPTHPDLMPTAMTQDIVFHNPQGIWLGREPIAELEDDELDLHVQASLEIVVTAWQDVVPLKMADAEDFVTTEILDKFGFAYAADEEINGGDMVDWLGNFMPTIRSVWLANQTPSANAP